MTDFISVRDHPGTPKDDLVTKLDDGGASSSVTADHISFASYESQTRKEEGGVSSTVIEDTALESQNMIVDTPGTDVDTNKHQLNTSQTEPSSGGGGGTTSV